MNNFILDDYFDEKERVEGTSEINIWEQTIFSNTYDISLNNKTMEKQGNLEFNKNELINVYKGLFHYF